MQTSPQTSNKPFALSVTGLIILTLLMLLFVIGMNHQVNQTRHPIGIPGAFIFLIIIAWLTLACVALFFFYRRKFGYGREKAFLISFATLFCTIGSVVWRIDILHRSATRGSPLHAILPLVTLGLLVPITIAFFSKLHSKWVDGHLTEPEKAPGGEGIRAWLSTGNIVFIFLIALLSWLALDISFVVMLAILFAALIAYPLLNSPEPTAAVPAQRQSEDVSSERERILRMLENGRINPEESTDLLNALGTTIVPETTQRSEPLTTNRRLVLAGAALVLLGFFLPWFSIDPARELGQLSGQMQTIMNGMIRQSPIPIPQNMFPQMPSPQIQQSGQGDTTIDIAGGDIRHGLGWLVLVIALASAALPYIATRMDHKTQTTVSLFALGIGSVVVLYLVTQEFHLVAVGLIVTTIGYALEFIGTLRKDRTLALLDHYPGADQTTVYLKLNSTFAGDKQKEIDAKIKEMNQQGWTFLRATEANLLRTSASWGGGVDLHFIRTN